MDGAEYIEADLSQAAEVERAIMQVNEPVDILFNNAGVMRRGTIFDSTEEDYDFLMNNNVKSAWLFLKYAKPKLVDRALVIQVSSGHALKPEPNPGLYTLSKKTTAALAEVLALTCPDYDVRMVYPGPVLTPLLLSGRTPADQERITKLALGVNDFAKKVLELIESSHRELHFVDDAWDYEIVD